MTTTPPEAPQGPDPREAPDAQGPRVSAAEARDLSRLRRSSTDRHVAGVAGGLGRHLDVDPVVLRVAFVVLAFFGGAGLLLYAAGWLFVPRDDTGEATIDLDARNRNVVLVLVGVVAALALLGDVAGGDWWFPWPLVLVGLFVAWLLSRRDARRGEPPAAAAEGTPVLPPPTRSPRRRGPRLFLFTLALVALAIGILATVDLAGAQVAAAAYPALALALVGAVLVVGAFFGRAGGLILVGLLLLPVLGIASAADHHEGEELLRVPTSADALAEGYRIDAGEMVIDLTSVADLDRLDGRTLTLEADLGRIEVLVPAGLEVVASGVVSAGHIDLFGDETGGIDTALRRTSPGRDGDAPRLTIDAEVGLGEIEMRTP
ncbi:PspC domain-containing protein [Nocardioides sp. SOB44]|uniref:PspC domain-containing protein n=1 Tax=Nocardioides cremeus TaxID=3058044 RepID=A0ABT8TS01_9ACTN|nr:PspC domain-containing protein [Nocardioides cremeus]MDO3396740.1 PspC domain-containing protein [Nocardioides cremeus]